MYDNVTLYQVNTNRCVAMSPYSKCLLLSLRRICMDPATVEQKRFLLTKRFFIGAKPCPTGNVVIPAKAGIQCYKVLCGFRVKPGMAGDDIIQSVSKNPGRHRHIFPVLLRTRENTPGQTGHEFGTNMNRRFLPVYLLNFCLRPCGLCRRRISSPGGAM